VEDERVAGQLLHDVYDEWDDHRQPTVSWCFSFMMLIMFMMILQSTMTVNVPADGSGGGVPSPSPPVDPAGAAGAAAGLLAGFSLVVVWLLSKMFLVVLPLLMVMRLAARAQVRFPAQGLIRVGSSCCYLQSRCSCCDDNQHSAVQNVALMWSGGAAIVLRFAARVLPLVAGTSCS
jgi:hypothetical protein